MPSLPHDVLVRRLLNEIGTLCNYLGATIDVDHQALKEFPLEMRFKMRNVPAFTCHGSRIRKINEHTFRLIISEDYPFEKPRVRWETPIFHPNIMDPEDGGHVCIKLLDTWTFNSSLVSFIRGVEHLIMNPNPMSPFGTDSCMEAAKHFLGDEADNCCFQDVPGAGRR